MKNNCPEHLKIELGYALISPIAQATMAYREVNYLLMSHVFKCGYRRAGYDFLPCNPRMNTSFLSNAYPFEFVQKNHGIYKNRGQD